MTDDSLAPTHQQQQQQQQSGGWNDGTQPTERLKAAEQQVENNRNREAETMRPPTCGGEVKQQPKPMVKSRASRIALVK